METLGGPDSGPRAVCWTSLVYKYVKSELHSKLNKSTESQSIIIVKPKTDSRRQLTDDMDEQSLWPRLRHLRR